MSFILQNQRDREYILKLCQEIKIIKQSKLDWSVQDVIRFSSLIKIDDCIKDILTSYEIDGNKLFDIEYLNSNLQAVITDKNYMPLYKLLFVVNAILEISQISDRQEDKRKGDQQPKLSFQDANEIEIDDDKIILMKQQLHKMNNMNIIQLGCNQLSKMLRNIQMAEQSQSVKKWNVDGFSLLCIIGNDNEVQTYRNYYSDEDLKLLNKLSHLFIHMYYFQGYQQQLKNEPQMMKIPTIEDYEIDFNEINFNPGSSFHSQYQGVSQPGDMRSQGLQQQGQQLRNYEYPVPVRGSLSQSQTMDETFNNQRQSLAESVYVRQNTAESVYARQSMAESVYDRQSMAESDYTGSQIMQDQSTQQSRRKEVAGSYIEDLQNFNDVMSSALQLPFNLLDLQPLQKIRVTSLVYPFSVGKNAAFAKKETYKDLNDGQAEQKGQKNQSVYALIQQESELREFKVFNLMGARFGRSPDNDFSYPDELSISGKHAQIVFRDDSYYIRDLGSKTGTFVYISERKPLVLSDEQLVQLSYQVELRVRILKNDRSQDINEGVIKFQFKKPDNEPPYRAILKNNNTVRIGKAENSHIKLANQSISYHHAQIRFEQGKFLMYDCGTRTGTWLRLSPKGLRSLDRKLTIHDIFRISSKKTFLVQDITDGIHFRESCCQEDFKKQL